MSNGFIRYCMNFSNLEDYKNLYYKMKLSYNSKYPSIEDLREKAKKKIPKLAFEYLDGGCNENINILKNTSELREIELKPYYLSGHAGSSMKTNLFGHEYDAPFGIAPVGLQGLMWPKAPEILAKAEIGRAHV